MSLTLPSVSQEYASPALVQNKLEKARIVPAFLVTANQTDVYRVSLHHRTLSLLLYVFIPFCCLFSIIQKVAKLP